MAEQSQFSRLPKKQLVLICEQLIEKNFPTNPYESYQYGADMENLSDIANYFGIDAITDEDFQFFSKF